jgi:hypothetical protein
MAFRVTVCDVRADVTCYFGGKRTAPSSRTVVPLR